MWIMTTLGFFSIIQVKGSPQEICIRGRKKADLRALKHRLEHCSPIVTTKHADYRFRMFISRTLFEQQFWKLLGLVNYSNFKDAVKMVNPRREQTYHRVWYDLLEVEHEDKPKHKREFDFEEVPVFP